MTLCRVAETRALHNRVEVDVYIQGRKLRALLDSGAAWTIISPRAVEKYEIPFRIKDRPQRVVLADESAVEYGKGMINLETEEILTEIAGFKTKGQINIMDLGEWDMLVGFDWLRKHNPAIDWQTGRIQHRAPTAVIAGVRRKGPRIQSSPNTGRIGRISAHKIGKIYEKRPSDVGVIWIRQVASPDDGLSTKIPKGYGYEEFQELFEENMEHDLADHQEWDHEIHLEDGAKLRPGPIYPLTQDQQEELRAYIKRNVQRGYIRPSESSMASPILFVPKKNGKLRLCVDYRQLNSVTKKNRYPLPLIQELMDKLQGTKWMTKFDVRDGYHRIRIAEGHEWLTAFKTRYGLYEYCVMPFGLTNAPATFQALINKALNEYLDVFATAYLDDVLVYSRGTLEEHVGHVKKVLQKMKEYRLLLHPDKCEFHVTETEYLGFIISRDGVAMNQEKVRTVQEWPTPKTVRDVQSFLGFANFYRKFIKDYSKTASPLSEITKKEIGFRWNQKQEQAFQELKRAFTQAPMLQMHDPQRKTRVETDASDYALGAILSQQCEDGKWRPVFYHSRKFSGAELNYDVHDKELLAIVDAFEQWEAQLKGARYPIEVYSDHQNLTSFMTTKKLNRRQVRWAESMADYDFRIHHRKGTDNGAADALSRRSDLVETDKPDTHDAVLVKETDGTLQYNHPRLARIAAIWEVEDKWEQKVKQDQGPNAGRLQVREEWQDQLLKDLHESKLYGHPGVDKMVDRVNRRYQIPGLHGKVRRITEECTKCQRNKPKRHQPYGLLQPLPPPSRPWSSVTMDFIVKLPKSREPGSARLCDSILVIVDRLTKFAYYIPTEETVTAEEMAYEVTRTLTANHGVPDQFITDRDKLFTSTFWKTFLASLGIDGRLSTSFHPQTDGQTERTNQTLEQYLRMYVNKLQDNWVELLPTAQLAYNSTKSATTGQSPFYANYGYEPMAYRDPKDIESISEGAQDKAQRMQRLHQELSKRIAQRNLTTSVQANKKRIEGPILKEGGKVFLSRKNLNTKRPCRKLDNLRLGPFMIEKVLGPVTFKLQLPETMRIHPVFHKSLLEPAPENAEIATEIELEDDEYEVEEVVDLKKFGRQWKYLVKWAGWPTSQNTWEPQSNLTNCGRLVEDYHRKHPDQEIDRRRHRVILRSNGRSVRKTTGSGRLNLGQS